MAEEVCGAPKNLDSGLLLLGLHVPHDLHEIRVGCIEIDAAVRKEGGGGHVPVVERVELDAQHFEQLERGIDGVARALHEVRGHVPWKCLAAAAKDVAAVAEEGVPPDDGKTEVVLERLAVEQLRRVVPVEGIKALR